MNVEDIEAKIGEMIGRLERFDGRIVLALEELTTAFGHINDHLKRIADTLSPEPEPVVGTSYVAGRLGCSLTWVAAMASNGTIPDSCVVPGTGDGKPWKFHREKIEHWIVSR